MEKAYWLGRQRASLNMAKSATSSRARLAHYDLAGRYSVNAVSAETQATSLDDTLPQAVHARRTRAVIKDSDDT